MKNIYNQRFVFFSPPKGPEGLSSGDETVGKTIAEIDSALQKADELLATDSDKTDRMVVEDSKRTLSELRNNISTGSLTKEQNAQLEYALDKIRDITDKYNENLEDNPNNLSERTKEAAEPLFNAANETTNNAPEWLTKAVFGEQADVKPEVSETARKPYNNKDFKNSLTQDQSKDLKKLRHAAYQSQSPADWNKYQDSVIKTAFANGFTVPERIAAPWKEYSNKAFFASLDVDQALELKNLRNDAVKAQDNDKWDKYLNRVAELAAGKNFTKPPRPPMPSNKANKPNA